ncbi:nuclear pore complex subunit [Sorochytrium milnesiophthora]
MGQIMPIIVHGLKEAPVPTLTPTAEENATANDAPSQQPVRRNTGAKRPKPELNSSGPLEQMRPDLFHHLAAQSKRLEHALEDDERPQIERGLEQLERASRSLATRSARAAMLEMSGSLPAAGSAAMAADGTVFVQQDDARAHHLLASSGFDVDEAISTLNTLRVQATLDAQRSIPPTDVPAYTDYNYEESVLSLLESVASNTLAAADILIDHAANVEWELSKRQIMLELGQFTPAPLSSVASDSPDKLAAPYRSVYGMSTQTPTMGTSFRTTQLYPSVSGTGQSAPSPATVSAYRSTVAAINDQRVAGNPFDIIGLLQRQLTDLANNSSNAANVSSSTASSTNNRLQESWSLLRSLLSSGGFSSFNALEFAGAYLDPQSFHGAGHGAALRKRLVKGARSFLETQFFDFLEATVAAQPKRALVGGAPSVQAQVAGFVRSRFYRYGHWDLPNLDIVNGHALWAQIYYLLRSGKRQEALDYAQQSAFHFSTLGREEGSFCAHLEAWVQNGELPQMTVEHLRQFCANHLTQQQQVDPFKVAIYSILGRSKATNMPEVIQATEDWLWLKLMLIRAEDTADAPASPAHTLSGLQSDILRLESQFSKNKSSPFKYFQCLLMAGLFEAAVLYLYRFEDLQVHAIHFGIALQYFGLLRTPREVQTLEPQIESADGTLLVNMPAILQVYYTKFLTSTDPTTAMHYILALAMYVKLPEMGGIKQLACDAMVELITKSPNQEVLVGQYLADGQRKPGLLERYLPLLGLSQKEYILAIVSIAAQRAEELDDLYYAVTLYMLSEDFDAALLVLSRHLADTFVQGHYGRSQRDGNAGPRNAEELRVFAERVRALFTQPSKWKTISDSMVNTMSLVYNLLDWRALLDAGRVPEALDFMASLRILPLGTYDDQQEISALAQRLRTYDPLIQQVMPTVFVKTMQLLSSVARDLSQSRHLDAARREKLEQYRRKARNLVSFAAQLPFRMDGDVYATLNRMEVELPSP